MCRPPLGQSDHNVVHLLPKYRQKVKTEGTQTNSCQLWTHDSIEELCGCFEAMNWDVFTDNCTDLDVCRHGNIVCEILQTVIKTKSVHVYPNNKPWVTKDLKVHLNQKKLAFLKGKKEEYKEKEKEFRKNARAARLRYKNKAEEKFRTGNAREAWSGLRVMMCTDTANELNTFHARFDVRDFSEDCANCARLLCQSSSTFLRLM